MSSSQGSSAAQGTTALHSDSPEPSAAAEPKLSWWWSRDDERFYGPSFSRADAIMDAWADDADQGAWICQASQGEWRTDIIDDGWLAEVFDDANEEHADPDGDGPSCLLSGEDWKHLAGRLNRIIHAAIRDKGLAAWGFDRQYPSEWINIPTMWRAAEADAAQQVEASASAERSDAAQVVQPIRDEP